MEFLNKIRVHLIALVVIILANVAYFYPQLDGKKIEQGDISHFVGMSKEARDYNKTHDDIALWTNSMFGGMPTYQIGAPQPSNISRFFQNLFQVFMERPIGYFISMMIGFYILMLTLRIDPWLGLIGALAFAWTTNHFVLFEAGHTSKLEVIASLPVLTAGLVLLLRRLWLPGLTIYAIGMGVNIFSNHVQMTYYFGITLIILAIIELVKWVRASQFSVMIKTGIFILAGSTLAMGLSASKLLTTREYSEDTMRGKPILEQTAGDAEKQPGTVGSSSTTEGLDWEYAMRWSNGNADVIASIIPGFAGGSGREYIKKGSELEKILKQNNIRPQRGENKIRVPTYWGPLPFTSGPSYFGAIMIFLFVLGALLVKNNLKWWLIGGVVLTVFLSYGKNMEVFQRLFFEHFPLYNKFRTPNSIMSITAFLIPVLALMGAAAALDSKRKKDEVWKALKIAGGTTAGFCLLMWLLGSTFFTFSAESDEQMWKDAASLVVDYRISVMKSDALRSAVLILLTAGAIWAFINKKLKLNYAVLLIGGLVLIDMAGIGQRYLNHNTFKSGRTSIDGYVMRPVDEQILKMEPKGRGYYRVLDLSTGGDPFSSADASYFHNALNGYHAAKLQRIQDIIDRHIAKQEMNLRVLNMFNTKYLIQRQGTSEQDAQTVVTQNSSANGPAWFVSKVIPVTSPNEEIDQLNDFDEKTDAIVLKPEFPDVQIGSTYSGEGNIELTTYEPNKLVYETSVLQGEHMAVFSEVWYGPDKGWQAYIDDEPVEHFRANYILRGLIIPEGKHVIRFEFKPETFYTGVKISKASSIILVLLILLNGFAYFRKPEWLGLKAQTAKVTE